MENVQAAARVVIVRESKGCRVVPPTVVVHKNEAIEFSSVNVERATIVFPPGAVKPSEPQHVDEGSSVVFTAAGDAGSYPYCVFCGGERLPFELAEGNSEPKMIIR